VSFVARQMPQLFPERSSVVADEWVPSVRVSSGVDFARWSRFLADRLYTVARVSPDVRRVAAQIESETGGQRGKIPEAITRWVKPEHRTRGQPVRAGHGVAWSGPRKPGGGRAGAGASPGTRG
jgi:hypothetical protein